MNVLEIFPLAPSVAVQSFAEKAVKFAEASRASSTCKAYTSDLAYFEGFCAEHVLPYLPPTPETVVLYVTYLASWVAVSTIKRRLQLFRQMRQLQQKPSASGKQTKLCR